MPHTRTVAGYQAAFSYSEYSQGEARICLFLTVKVWKCETFSKVSRCCRFSLDPAYASQGLTISWHSPL
jgi:hypothetical protein